MTTRLRNLETRAKTGDSLESLTDDQLFARTRDGAGRLVANYGGLEAALTGLEAEGFGSLGVTIQKALNSASTDEFMDRPPGWDAWKRLHIQRL